MSEIPEGYIFDTGSLVARFTRAATFLSRARARRQAQEAIIEAARAFSKPNRSLAETGEARMALAGALERLDRAS